MGALTGIKVLEMAGIGPAPFCSMMLADMGAEVIRIDRLNQKGTGHRGNIPLRSRRSIALDLKDPVAVETVLRMVEQSDVILEGFRPGVMERLGLGPDVCLQKNPGIVFGRMTGWGQEGPLAMAAGHDINYISVAGALGAMGHADRPPAPPLNLVGDFGGGAMYLLTGILAALLERSNSGKGQIIDAAMTDGTASLLSPAYGMMAMDMWTTNRQDNKLDGGAHYYGSYECSDGKYISIGSIEPQFYALLLELCEIEDKEFELQNDKQHWPSLRKKLESLFITKSRDQWCVLLEATDVCFAPILDLKEAPDHPHNRSRGTFAEHDGVLQPAPAPRFSRTPSSISARPCLAGEHSEEILSDWGFSADEIEQLRTENAI